MRGKRHWCAMLAHGQAQRSLGKPVRRWEVSSVGTCILGNNEPPALMSSADGCRWLQSANSKATTCKVEGQGVLGLHPSLVTGISMVKNHMASNSERRRQNGRTVYPRLSSNTVCVVLKTTALEPDGIGTPAPLQGRASYRTLCVAVFSSVKHRK